MNVGSAYLRIGVGSNLIDRARVVLVSTLFFLVSTPFELDQSGFVYLTKAAALGGLIAYAVVFRGAGFRRLLYLPLLAALVVLVLNTVVVWADRAMLGVAMIVLGTLLGQMRSARWDSDLERVLRYVIWLNVAGLLFSFMYFYLTGAVVDLHGLMFPNPSRAESLGAFARLSGFHTEPGTYAQWTLMLLFFYSVVRGKYFGLATIVVLVTCVMTVSLWALAGVTAFLIAVSIEALTDRSKSRIWRLVAITSLISLAAALFVQIVSPDTVYAILHFLQLKGSFMTDSGTDKIRAAHFFLNELPNVLLFGRPIDPGFCPYCLSPQDAGLGMNVAYYFGFMLAFLLIANLLVKLLRFRGVAFVLPLGLLLAWKAHFYDPLLWVIVGYILSMGLPKRRTAPRLASWAAR